MSTSKDLDPERSAWQGFEPNEPKQAAIDAMSGLNLLSNVLTMTLSLSTSYMCRARSLGSIDLSKIRYIRHSCALPEVSGISSARSGTSLIVLLFTAVTRLSIRVTYIPANSIKSSSAARPS